MMSESCLFRNNNNNGIDITVSLNFIVLHSLCPTRKHGSYVINVFMCLQRLIYGYISLVVLYCYYYIPIISQYSQVVQLRTSAGASSSSSSSHFACTRQATQTHFYCMLIYTARKTFASLLRYI